MPVAKLTKRLAEATTVPAAGESWVWDTEVRGLGLKLTPGGRRVFFVKYRVPGVRATKKLQLGPFGPLTVDQARLEAKRVLGDVATGVDPARERARGKAAPLLAEALDQYLADHKGRWKPRTSAEYTRQANDIIKPALGTLRVQDVTRESIAAVVRRLQPTPILANRVLALLSAFFTWTIKSGIRPDELNPCRYHPRHVERGRKRFLTGEELMRLGEALRQAELGEWTDEADEKLPTAAWQSLAAIRLLLFTGCRRNEILDLRWSEVDFARGLLLLRDTKTEESVRPLSAPARAILEGLTRGNPADRVLAGTRGRRHDLIPAWYAVRRVAKIPDVRLHDLRHTVASRSQHAGHSLLITGSLLGHRDLATTKKYAHLIPEPLQAAADHVFQEIDSLVSKRSTPVQPITRPAKKKHRA
jgi:integrase